MARLTTLFFQQLLSACMLVTVTYQHCDSDSPSETGATRHQDGLVWINDTYHHLINLTLIRASTSASSPSLSWLPKASSTEEPCSSASTELLSSASAA